MDLSKVAVFRMTTGKMSWLTERQRVLSQNIANSDTPKYKPQDMKEVDFRKLVKRNTRSVALYRTRISPICRWVVNVLSLISRIPKATKRHLLETL